MGSCAVKDILSVKDNTNAGSMSEHGVENTGSVMCDTT